MDQEKIGKFISSMRKEKNMTQQELGDHLGVSYKSVSKWERGISFPDISLIVPLTRILGITVNELLNGIKENKDSGIESYFKRQKKKNKSLVLISIISALFIFIFLTLGLYFINNYNKIEVYTISGENENFYYGEALFIKSNIDNIYVYGKLDIKNESITKITYVEVLDDKNHILRDNNLFSSYLLEPYGYNEHFTNQSIKNIENWHLEVTYEIDGEFKIDNIKLNIKSVMKNTKFITKRMTPISDYIQSSDEQLRQKKLSIENAKIKEQELKRMGFTEVIKYNPETMEPLEEIHTGKELTDEYIRYSQLVLEKKYDDGSRFEIRSLISNGLVSYYSEDYTVEMHPMNSNKFIFRSGDNEEKFIYEYFKDSNSGKCKKGTCPEDFIEIAKEYTINEEKTLRVVM